MYDNGYQYGQEGEWLGELLAVPVDPRYQEPITVLHFDHQYEALWAGTESGMLYTLQCPMLTRYASWQAHPSAVLDLQLLSDCAVSISSSRMVLSTHGGFTRAAANITTESDTWVSAVVEPGTGSGRLLLAGSSGHLYTHDLITNKITAQEGGPIAADGLSLLRGPVGHRGAVAAATAAGRLLMIDSRTNWQVGSSTLAHVGGISALEVQGDLVATSGYSRRLGQVMDDNFIKVFDCRSVVHPLFTVPCACPGMLSWHPINSMTLLCASASGMFMFADPSNPAAVEPYQVDTAGDTLRCACISPSGDAVAFGGAGGYCHLWAASMQPRITARSRQIQRLTQPTRQSKKTVISEAGPFSAAPSPQSLLLDAAKAAGATSAAAAAAAAASTRLLSDVPDMLVISVGKPPRIVDEGLKKELKQVDFIGYIPNPHYSRSKAPGAARKAALPLQHKRIELKVDKRAAEAKATKQNRLAESGLLLPRRYRRLVIKTQSSIRFEEFDFTYYNKTKFAGLENDLPNCYCNALLQVLYFTPSFRSAILQHKPEPDLEFCLTCELLFLFKMLLSAAGGLPCQALNLLRALRQNRKAAALGLLEGTVSASTSGGLGCAGGSGPGSESGWGLASAGLGAKPYEGAGGLGAGVEGGLGSSSAWGCGVARLAARSVLPRRVVTLCRFLLDHLFKEAGGESAATADSSSNTSSDTTATALTPAAAAEGGGGATAAAASGDQSLNQHISKDIKTAKDATAAAAAADKEDGHIASKGQQQQLSQVIQELFGLCYRSDTTALSGAKKGTSKSRQLRTFQVDLIYPAAVKDSSSGSSSRTPVAAAQGSGSGGGPFSPTLSSLGSPAKTGISAASLGSPSLTDVTSTVASPRSPLPPFSPLPAAATTPTTPAAAAALSLSDKPSFGALLASSLKHEEVTKAWFDEGCGYAYVKQSRVPLELPKVLVVNCAVTNPTQIGLWQPIKSPAGAAAAAASPSGSSPGAAEAASVSSSSTAANAMASPAASPALQQQQHERAWLPWVLQIRSDPSNADVDVITANTVAELEEMTRGAAPAPVQATYELSAMICHIVDEAEVEQTSSLTTTVGRRTTGGLSGAGGSSSALNSLSPVATAGSRTAGDTSSSNTSYQGHVVAVIRVQQPYLDSSLVGGLQRFPSAVDKLMSHGSGIPAAAAAAGSSGSGTGAAAAAVLSRRLSSSGSGGGLNRVLSGSGALKKAGSGGAAAAAAAGFGLPDNLDDVFAELSMTTASNMDSRAAAAAVEGEPPGNVQQQQQQRSDEGQRSGDQPTPGAAADSSQENPAAAIAAAAVNHIEAPEGGAGQQWVVINDFSISSISPCEVMNWYHAQKLPCLLFYTQVSELSSWESLPPPDPPSPVDAHTFQTLCNAPPLQGPSWRGRRAFVPLEFPREAPRPGFMVAIDAEFVAVSRPETSFEGGVEVQLKPSRLALARVSVLRGSGPLSGTAFIDDYVMSVEPVVDYLTRYSGIRPGDLDPSTSQHYLVSLKTAYLKLHHLLDAGCVFIGHGLKQDFRMLNLNVPPEQVRDTVELFSFRRQRKLSLRFLASYLLGLSIQTGTGAAGAAAAAAAAAATSSPQAAEHASAGAVAGKQAQVVTAAAVAAGVSTAGSVGAAGSKTGLKAATTAAAAGSNQGHDSIEDAATALALYNVYCKLKSEGKLEEKLHEMYRWGKTYGWDPVVHVNGAPQPPLATVS